MNKSKKIFQNTKTDILMILTYFALIRCARAFPISIVANLGGESANEKCGRTLAHNFASCDKRRTPICALVEDSRSCRETSLGIETQLDKKEEKKILFSSSCLLHSIMI